MATLYNTVPANVTFKNTLTATKVTDAGAEVRGVEYKEDAIRVQLFQLNEWLVVARDEEVTIKVETSEEIAYYKALEAALDGLTVTVAAA